MTAAHTPASSLPDTTAAGVRPRLRLDFLDGLRGLAALYVALFHVVGAQRLAQTGLPLRLATGWMHYGYYAVDVFIVLSGYCLMLPVARAADRHLRGGLGQFFHRRARRILPPYYAACAASLLLILAARLAKTHVQADEPGVFASANLLAHLLLLHNLQPAWSSSINIVLWSVATEWQIYFVFALLLLPVWRRFGSLAAIGTGFFLGFLPHWLLPTGHNLDQARPWYIGLFAMGMAGAVLGFSAEARQAYWRARLPWGWLSLGFFAAACLLEGLSTQEQQSLWLKDPLVGAATVCLIIRCAQALTNPSGANPPFLLHIFERPWVVGLGTFSYSLYLMNIPAMWIFKLALHPLHLAPSVELGVRILAGPLFMVVVAYPFHLAFERPFLSTMQHPRPAAPDHPADPPVLEVTSSHNDGAAEAAIVESPAAPAP